jgi:hypothetical protein
VHEQAPQRVETVLRVEAGPFAGAREETSERFQSVGDSHGNLTSVDGQKSEAMPFVSQSP